MKDKQRFSIRKYKVGVVSALIGLAVVFGGQAVFADEITANASETKMVNTMPVEQEQPQATADVQQTEVPVDNQNNEPVVESQNTTEPVSDAAVTEPVSQVNESLPAVPATSANSDEAPVSMKSVSSAEISDETSQELSQKAVSEHSAVDVTTSQSAKPNNIDSNAVMNIPKAWHQGYKGEGTVVAVIDSGLDVNHDVLHVTDLSKAKYQSKEQIEAAMKSAGIDYGHWYNDKVIYGYNYMDANDNLKEGETASHGMHVTSIATGNPSKPVGGELIIGVAPEAQVMFMRVFADWTKSTGASLYVRAIDDAVKLGADVINLSLGSTTGSVVNADETLVAAVERASKAGVSVVFAAGNEGTFGSGATNPLAENPDYGLVGSPSTTRDVISVASYNNPTTTSEVINVLGQAANASLNYGKLAFNNPDKSDKKFETGKVYDYLYVGKGTTDDLTDVDLTGKLALIERGDITFSEKVANAAAKGALGAVIFNNKADEANLSMALDESGSVIPSLFIEKRFGDILAKNNYQLQFNHDVEKSDNVVANEMSDFSSWGLSTDGELKPDVTAPGGSIYAAYNDNRYGNMSGTSMASPHIAGLSALVKQYLEKEYPDKKPEEVAKLVKQLIMSNAKPHMDSKTNAYTSPRQQGAGIADAGATLNNGLYVTGDDDYPSLTLGNVADSFSFNVTVHNISNEAKTLHYVTHLQTDQIEDGKATLHPRELSKIDGADITIAPHSSKTVTVTVDASSFAQELQKQMPNGYYLEGFVRFTDPVDGGDVVSIPYVGFRGEFQNLAALEKTVYKLVADGKGGVYYTPTANNTVNVTDDVTGLVTESSDIIYSLEVYGSSKGKVLGSFKDSDGQFVLALDKDGKPHLAISPNGDGNQDYLMFKGVFLRNYDNLTASVYAADDANFANPLWTSEATSGLKNYYSGDSNNKKSSLLYNTQWSGQDKDNNNLPDGKYKYVLTYTPSVPGAKQQMTVFDVTIDREAPIITTATYDENTKAFKPRPVIEQGVSGIYRERVFYLASDANGSTVDYNIDPTSQLATTADNRVYLTRNEDGSYTLPLDLAPLDKFYYTVEDYAGNETFAKVKDLLEVGNENGVVQVNLVDKETGEPLSTDFSYRVKDAQGNLVQDVRHLSSNSQKIALPLGDYTIELFLLNTNDVKLAGEALAPISLTEAKSFQTVNFEVTPVVVAPVTVSLVSAVPSGTTVSLINEVGSQIDLPETRYVKGTFGKSVPVGQYTVKITLPEGYDLLEEKQDLTVVDGQSTDKVFHIVDKRTLLATLTEQADVSQQSLFYNANPELAKAYVTAVASAKEVATSKQNQAAVDSALDLLTKAYQALNGQPTDYSALDGEVKAYGEVKGTSAYYNASPSAQSAYDSAVSSAQTSLATGNLPQSAVDDSLSALKAARQGLDGQPTDYSALDGEVKAYDDVKGTRAYYNASPSARSAYDSAVSSAQTSLATGNLPQSAVDDSLSALKSSRQGLDGQPTDYSALDSEVKAYDEVKGTSAYYNASPSVQSAYDSAVSSAQISLATGNLPQSAVDDSLSALKSSRQGLDGQVTDYGDLRQQLAKGQVLQQTSAKYRNASRKVKSAFDEALNFVQEVLADDKVQQELVNKAKELLEASEQDLDGKEQPNSSHQETVKPDQDIAKISDAKPTPPRASVSTFNRVEHTPDVLSNETVHEWLDVAVADSEDEKPITKPVVLTEKTQQLGVQSQAAGLPKTADDSTLLLTCVGLGLVMSSIAILKVERQDE